MMYGSQYEEKVLETIRHAAELCDSLQCFFLLHSMGGGILSLRLKPKNQNALLLIVLQQKDAQCVLIVK